MAETQVRWLFRSAAIFNWLAATALFAPLGIAEFIGVRPVPGGGPYEIIMTAAIAVFGFGYWWVAQAPGENLGIVKLGLLGKVAVVAITYYFAWVGPANAMLALLVSGDLVYAALFTLFLCTYRQEEPAMMAASGEAL